MSDLSKPRKNLNTYLKILAAVCFGLTVFHLKLVYDQHQLVGPGVESTEYAIREYNYIWNIILSALSGGLLLWRPTLGSRVYIVYAVVEIALLSIYMETLKAKNVVFVVYVLSVLIYAKLFSKIKRAEQDARHEKSDV